MRFGNSIIRYYTGQNPDELSDEHWAEQVADLVYQRDQERKFKVEMLKSLAKLIAGKP